MKYGKKIKNIKFYLITFGIIVFAVLFQVVIKYLSQ